MRHVCDCAELGLVRFGLTVRKRRFRSLTSENVEEVVLVFEYKIACNRNAACVTHSMRRIDDVVVMV